MGSVGCECCGVVSSGAKKSITVVCIILQLVEFLHLNNKYFPYLVVVIIVLVLVSISFIIFSFRTVLAASFLIVLYSSPAHH